MNVPLRFYGWPVKLLYYVHERAVVQDHGGTIRRFVAEAMRNTGCQPGDTIDFGVYVVEFFKCVAQPDHPTDDETRLVAYDNWVTSGFQQNGIPFWRMAEGDLLRLWYNKVRHNSDEPAMLAVPV